MSALARWIAGAALAALVVSDARASEWSAADRALLAGAMALHLADWSQTRTIATDDRWYERNPILGRHPTRVQVDAYFAGTALLMLAAAHYLPSWRTELLTGYVVVGFMAVGNNLALGIRVGF
jgi:uncharacterized membrane protein